jgi:hypothetical protein
LLTLLNTLPELVSNTSEVAVSGVTVKVDRNVADRLSPELMNALERLSVNTIKFIETNELGPRATMSSTQAPSPDDKIVYSELIDAKLCQILDK